MPRARIEGEADAGGEGFGPDLDWLGSTTSIEMLVIQAAAAERDWSFGWIRLAKDAKLNDLVRSLQGSGTTIIGYAGSLMRARLPGDEARLQEIAALPEVDGLGAVPRERKLAEAFANEALEALPHEQTPVFITLMTDDPAGQWRRELEDLGAVVGRFDPDIRVYTANVSYGALETIAAADFVLAIEPIGIIEPAHDTSVPAMGADALRRYDGSPGLFSGRWRRFRSHCRDGHGAQHQPLGHRVEPAEHLRCQFRLEFFLFISPRRVRGFVDRRRWTRNPRHRNHRRKRLRRTAVCRHGALGAAHPFRQGVDCFWFWVW